MRRSRTRRAIRQAVETIAAVPVAGCLLTLLIVAEVVRRLEENQ